MIKLYTYDNPETFIFVENYFFSNISELSENIVFDFENDKITIDGTDYRLSTIERDVDESNTSSGCTCETTVVSTSVHIPQLKLAVKKIYQTSDGSRIDYPTDRMFVSWQSNDFNFMLHNPEIWLFRYKKGTVKNDSESVKLLKTKKMVHPPHLNGIKYPGSNFYAGTSVNYFDKPYETEFSFNATPDNFFEVPIKIQDFFYKIDNKGHFSAVERDTRLRRQFNYYASGSSNQSIVAALAIVINNPNVSVNNPKIIGQFSNLFDMRILLENTDQYAMRYTLKNKI